MMINQLSRAGAEGSLSESERKGGRPMTLRLESCQHGINIDGALRIGSWFSQQNLCMCKHKESVLCQIKLIFSRHKHLPIWHIPVIPLGGIVNPPKRTQHSQACRRPFVHIYKPVSPLHTHLPRMLSSRRGLRLKDGRNVC
jgi:hypothetical protein